MTVTPDEMQRLAKFAMKVANLPPLQKADSDDVLSGLYLLAVQASFKYVPGNYKFSSYFLSFAIKAAVSLAVNSNRARYRSTFLSDLPGVEELACNAPTRAGNQTGAESIDDADESDKIGELFKGDFTIQKRKILPLK
jgi:hypothetical protein